MEANNQNMPSKPPRKSFGRILLWFTLGVCALVGASSVLKSIIDDPISGAGPKVAIVEIGGVITSSKDVVRQIKKYLKDGSVKGIILRINSPGGEVAPSQEIYNAVMKARKDKKMVASLGSLAASGGYYIASAADHIVSNPGTLTGSIGVIMASSNVEGLIEKIGLKPLVIKSGKYKDSLSPVRPMSKEERQILQSVVDDVHEQFINAIVTGRNLPLEEVEKIADGRIFTGRQAKTYHLVDQLGSLEDSIDFMKDTLQLEQTPRIVQEKEEQSFLEFLLQTYFPKRFSNKWNLSNFPKLQYRWYLGTG